MKRPENIIDPKNYDKPQSFEKDFDAEIYYAYIEAQKYIDYLESEVKKFRLGAVSSSLSFEEYIKEQIREGYISENGTPLKCWCGCTDFKQVEQRYCVHGIEEYSLQCTNIDCLKIVGHWAFGNWQF